MSFLLHLDGEGYSLRDVGSRQHPLKINFSSARLRYRLERGGKELLAKAVSAKPGVSVLDCTAGLGVDAFVLAARGCEVRMVERSATLGLMLDDAIARARQTLTGVASIAMRMSVIQGDARMILAHLAELPDVITIDPMFPPRKKTAEVKGELQLLQKFLGKDEDVDYLVHAARATGCKRVVVKRPLTAAYIDGLNPTFTLKGKASRFDVYLG